MMIMSQSLLLAPWLLKQRLPLLLPLAPIIRAAYDTNTPLPSAYPGRRMHAPSPMMIMMTTVVAAGTRGHPCPATHTPPFPPRSLPPSAVVCLLSPAHRRLGLIICFGPLLPSPPACD